MALRNLTDESTRTKADLRSKVEESLRAQETCDERLKRKPVNEVEKRQQLLAEHRETSESSSHQRAEGEDSLQGLQSDVVAMAAEQNQWFDLANETFGKLKTAEAYVTLQSSLWEAALEEMNAHTVEIAELQEQLTAKSAELSELLAKNSELSAGISRVKAQNVAGSTVLDNLKLVAGNCERH